MRLRWAPLPMDCVTSPYSSASDSSIDELMTHNVWPDATRQKHVVWGMVWPVAQQATWVLGLCTMRLQWAPLPRTPEDSWHNMHNKLTWVLGLVDHEAALGPIAHGLSDQAVLLSQLVQVLSVPAALRAQ